jgi:hypothetical protein
LPSAGIESESTHQYGAESGRSLVSVFSYGAIEKVGPIVVNRPESSWSFVSESGDRADSGKGEAFARTGPKHSPFSDLPCQKVIRARRTGHALESCKRINRRSPLGQCHKYRPLLGTSTLARCREKGIELGSVDFQGEIRHSRYQSSVRPEPERPGGSVVEYNDIILGALYGGPREEKSLSTLVGMMAYDNVR